MNDLELVQMAQQGNLDAFNQLVLKYQDGVYNLAYWIVKDSETAEDMAQDTFIKAYHRLCQFHGDSFRSWLMRMTRNTCIDELRRIKRQRIDQFHTIPQSDDEFEALPLPSSEEPVHQAVENREMWKLLEHSIKKLPSRYSMAVLLVDVLEVNYQEAAMIMDVPVGTIKSRVARARQYLRSRLKMYDEPAQRYAVPQRASVGHGLA